jgi:hypothetical protein
MSQLSDEIDANRTAFFKSWTAEAPKNWAALESNNALIESYRRLAALQALKSSVIARSYSKESAAFFSEAHNDALVSHVNASVGSWRSALQALRSCIENVLRTIYYNEHPVEYELWEMGEFLISFSELIKYAERHPKIRGVPKQLTGIEALKSEYATLSKAVHSSAAKFRMTGPASGILLWSTDAARASMWNTRERKVIEAASLLLLCFHRKQFEGTGMTPQRNVLYFCLSTASRQRLRTALKINIPTP